MTTSEILSPLASPFYPSRMENQYPFSVLYCNGIPTGIMNEHEAISNIGDDVLDEMFPPDAADAAEMDAVDEFLKIMVHFSLMEDLEEKCRSNLGWVSKKRWETKRKEGLKGKPHIQSGRVKRVEHGNMNDVGEDRLAPYARHSHLLHTKKNNRNASAQLSKQPFNKKIHLVHRYSKSIQQPRKQN